MTLTVHYTASAPHAGVQQTQAFPDQQAAEAWLWEHNLGATIVHGYVVNEEGLTIAEWRVDRPGFFAVAGAEGWCDVVVPPIYLEDDLPQIPRTPVAVVKLVSRDRRTQVTVVYVGQLAPLVDPRSPGKVMEDEAQRVVYVQVDDPNDPVTKQRVRTLWNS